MSSPRPESGADSGAAAERALRASEARYRTLAEHSLHGIWQVTPEGATTYANPALARLLEVEGPQDLIGRNFREFYTEESVREMDERIRRYPELSQQPMEADLITARGSRRRVLLTGGMVLGEDGRIESMIGSVLDVTEAQRSEEERRRLERKIEQAQRLESLGLLAGGIAHDFNNLLTGILGKTDIALMRLEVDSPVRPVLEAIEAAAERAAALTGQMLAYSGRGRFAPERLGLSQVVRETEALLRASVSKVATLEFDLPAGLGAVEADLPQLRQVLLNLATNASDALGDGPGRIRVRTGEGEFTAGDLAETRPRETLEGGRYAWLEVEDTGVGIDPGAIERIFDPFFTTKGPGRGLGLAAVLGIVRAHGGGVAVESRPGVGTRIRVLLPAAPESGPPPRDRQAQVRAGLRHRAVLVVDDEEVVRAVSRTALEDAGFVVVTAADGMEAVEVVRERGDAIALVLLDLTMPRMGGAEALQEIRRLRADLPVVLCSGYSAEEAAAAVAGRDPAAFLHKPFRVADLLRTVRAVVG